MSAAAMHANAFYDDVVRDRKVFTFLDDGSFLVFKIREYEVVPFWSTRTRIEKVQAAHPKYVHYSINEIALEKFLASTLSLLGEERLRVGVNWSGKRLTGYDVGVEELRSNIDARS